MLKSILVGLDGSPSSEVAVELGFQWAKRFNAVVVGLGIVDEATIRAPEVQPIGSGYYKRERDEELMKDARNSIEKLLKQLGTRCAEASVSCNLVQDTGLPYEEILRESHRYDLVIFGHETHFRFGTIDRPDETLWNVLKRAPRPVVVTPPKLEGGSSVVVAYNGSPQADRAMQAFQSSGLDFGEEVCVLSVNNDREAAVRKAERAVESLRLHGINAVSRAVEQADSVDQSILAEVRQRSARLLVMGAYGHSTVREFLLGSTTKVVLKESPVPVFLCH